MDMKTGLILAVYLLVLSSVTDAGPRRGHGGKHGGSHEEKPPRGKHSSEEDSSEQDSASSEEDSTEEDSSEGEPDGGFAWPSKFVSCDSNSAEPCPVLPGGEQIFQCVVKESQGSDNGKPPPRIGFTKADGVCLPIDCGVPGSIGYTDGQQIGEIGFTLPGNGNQNGCPVSRELVLLAHACHVVSEDGQSIESTCNEDETCDTGITIDLFLRESSYSVNVCWPKIIDDDGEDEESDSESSEFEESSDLEEESHSESESTSNDGESESTSNDGESESTSNDGESESTSNDGESDSTSNDGESESTSNDGTFVDSSLWPNPPRQRGR